MSAEAIKLVTLEGECFDATFEGKHRAADSDSVYYRFRLTDLTRNRGERRIELVRFGPDKSAVPNYDSRIQTVRLNTVRRAFDSATLSFEGQYDPDHCQHLPLTPADFQPQTRVGDPEIRQFIIHKLYWLSYRYSPASYRYPIQLDDPADLEYLGVEQADVLRNQWLLTEQGLLERSNIPGMGRPTATLVQAYESKQSVAWPTEHVFPPKTQYEAYKTISTILQGAAREIFVADNYLDNSLLDMLQAVPSQPAVKLLTSKPSPDFGVATTRFRAQYQRSMEVRIHNKQIHDRAIIIDDAQFYALGASIKDMGTKLSILNKLEDPTAMAKLRRHLSQIWASATPLA